MFYTYILQLSNNKYYVGHTSNLKQRFEYHSKGRVTATKAFRPMKLTFYAAFLTEELSIKFEHYLKSSSGFAFRNKRLV